MQITLQYFDECPNWELANERVTSALSRLGMRATDDVTYEVVDTPEKAEAVGFRGSPTILVNGVDPFADPADPIGLCCRLFATPSGLAGSPTVDQLMHAIQSSRS